jgi:hypothetical protein
VSGVADTFVELLSVGSILPRVLVLSAASGNRRPIVTAKPLLLTAAASNALPRDTSELRAGMIVDG